MMRLWHFKLLPYLPDKMLISEWRECIAIKRQWEKGTLKHRLVSYVMTHPRHWFLGYVNTVCTELHKRNIKYNQKYLEELEDFCVFLVEPPINYPEHNDRYLRQCYYNLQEKADRGIISKEDWENIHKHIYGLIKEVD